MTKELWGKTACKCAKCSHIWLEDLPDLPKNCANRQCRTTKWNKDEQAVEEKASMGTMLQEFAETERQLVAATGKSEFRPPTEKPYETFQKSLCSHGLYKPLCRRCQAAA